MKVAVYAICGAGEAPNIERFVDHCREADEVHVTLREDNKEVIDALNKEPVTYHFANITPFRFDDARNAALAMVPDTVDACVALDMDETLEPGWREALENAFTPSPIIQHPWAAWIDFNFNGTVFRQNNRVHSRHGWRWKHPCHEALVPNMQRETFAVETQGFTITHRPDLEKPRPNYLEMLAWGQFEEPNNLRMLHYYGRELMFKGHYHDAIERFDRYLAVREPGYFKDERDRTIQYRKECLDNLIKR